MLLLLHALSCWYILPSSPVLLHIAIYCTCFSTFWHCYPYILQHFNGNVFIPLYICYTTPTRWFSGYTKPLSGCSVTSLYHRSHRDQRNRCSWIIHILVRYAVGLRLLFPKFVQYSILYFLLHMPIILYSLRIILKHLPIIPLEKWNIIQNGHNKHHDHWDGWS